jgi:hypothetical protein
MMSVREMRYLICANHYSRSIPAGDSIFTQFDGAIIVFSRPANKNISRWLLGGDNLVWELSRMWAPDGHRKNLLTQAIPRCTRSFLLTLRRLSIPLPEALISFADPNAGHEGTVYRAASWIYLGCSEETRFYADKGGRVVPRRAFHSSRQALTKSEIEALGYIELRKPGKRRFARGLNRWAQEKIKNHAARPLDETSPDVASTAQPRGAAPNQNIG